MVLIKENIHILCESMAITAIAEEIIKRLTPMVFEQSQVQQRQEHGDSLTGFFFFLHRNKSEIDIGMKDNFVFLKMQNRFRHKHNGVFQCTH